MPAFATSIQHSTVVLTKAIRQEKEIKSSKLERRKQNYLFAGDMILYVENPKDFVRTINEFIKVAGCKLNTQKSFSVHSV